MQLAIILVFIGLAAIIGGIFGYFLRWVISLGKKGSMELNIKQMMLEAKDEAQRIVDEAEEKSEKIINEARSETKEKEEKIKKTEERLIKKEELLDNRQVDIDKSIETLKQKAEDVEKIQHQAEDLVTKRQEVLEQTAGLTKDQAKDELLKAVEQESEEDIIVRLQKLEQEGEDRSF